MEDTFLFPLLVEKPRLSSVHVYWYNYLSQGKYPIRLNIGFSPAAGE